MKTILVIDDDLDVRQCIRNILEQTGFTVLDAENGTVGLKLINQNKVDLVIVDLFMPEKEGIETIMELRKLYSGLKVIAISGGIPGYGPDSFLQVARKLGADCCLDKPFNMEQLIAVVNSTLQSA